MLNRDDDAKYVGSYDVQGTEELATNLQLEECCVETSTETVSVSSSDHHYCSCRR
jgi:hypothetical protein